MRKRGPRVFNRPMTVINGGEVRRLPIGTPVRLPRRSIRTLARRGYTLIELVLGMIVAALLMAGMASALVVASRAADITTDVAAHTTGARETADRITADLNHAVTLVSQNANSVSFTVSDRNGDGSPETIRYAWGGNVGDSLTREYNSSTAQTILENVQQFDLTYLATPAMSPPLQESLITSLVNNRNPVGGQLNLFTVDPNHVCAQFLKPQLPSNACSWSVTGARIMIARQSDGTSLVQIRSTTARQRPSAQVLAAVSLQTGGLPAVPTWVELAFTGVSGLDPSAGVCLVFSQTSGSAAGKVQYQQTGLSMPRNTHWMTSNDGGQTWTAPTSDEDMVFEVFGTITTQGPPQ